MLGGIYMTLVEKLMELANSLSDERLTELINFAEQLKSKEEAETRNLIDNLMEDYDEALKELAK